MRVNYRNAVPSAMGWASVQVTVLQCAMVIFKGVEGLLLSLDDDFV